MLKACPECGKKFSAQAKACPSCGYAPGKAAAFWLKLVGGLMVFGGGVASYVLFAMGDASPAMGGLSAVSFLAGLTMFIIGRFKE